MKSLNDLREYAEEKGMSDSLNLIMMIIALQ